ncbi:MAG: 30S ribosomal protein S20 [Patescibacteria group bacterium]|nr:30S ribosomal protein S20 [bacterium]MDZ4240986.1 30S ribosomal protein S20 [Patescibacteria group bacterium]
MAITKSAKKVLRASKHKRVFNIHRKETLTDVLKRLRRAIVAGNKAEALKLVPEFQKAVDKAQKRGVIKKNTADRKKSRMFASIKKIS